MHDRREFWAKGGFSVAKQNRRGKTLNALLCPHRYHSSIKRTVSIIRHLQAVVSDKEVLRLDVYTPPNTGPQRLPSPNRLNRLACISVAMKPITNVIPAVREMRRVHHRRTQTVNSVAATSTGASVSRHVRPLRNTTSFRVSCMLVTLVL